MKRGTLVSMVVLGAMSFGAVAWAQPAPSPPEPAPRENAGEIDRGPIDAARLRSWLERRLERSRGQQDRLEAAIKKLDEGADPGSLREEFRDLWTDREGSPDEGDRRDRRPPGPSSGPDGNDGAPAPPPMRVAPEDRERFLEFLRVEFPRMHERVMQELKNRPQDASGEIDPEQWPRIRPFIELMNLREQDPEMFGLRKDLWSEEWSTRDLARQVSSAADGEREALVAQLRAALEHQFDLQLQLHRLELARLEARLQNAKREADERETARDASVNERLVEMLSRPDDHRRGRPRPEAGPGSGAPRDRSP